MKHLQEYILENIVNIFEVAFSSSNWSHNGKYDYATRVIDDIINGHIIGLGSSKAEQYIKFELTNSDIDNLKDFKSNIISKSYQDFNNELGNVKYTIYNDQECTIKSNNQNIKSLWTSIFKGQYSGYLAGLSSKNKGNAFEEYFVQNFDKFESKIKDIVKGTNYDYKHIIGTPEHVGGANNRRPLTFTKDSITCGKIIGNNFNIGKTVSDVTLITDNKEYPIYLSLKSGSSVTFVNSGIKTLFTKEFFDGGELNGNGKLLLDMLSLDSNKFRNIFNSYNKDYSKNKSTKDTVNILDKLKDNGVFKKFMRSVIGCGFIMVHQVKGDNVEYISFLEEKNLNDFITDIKEAYILYPNDGKAKRIDIVVKYSKIEFKINLRSKDGGIYPTHIMADYKFI